MLRRTPSARAVCMLLGGLLVGCAGSSPEPQPTASPARLTVILVVDQMRGDFLDRFAGHLDGGLARLAGQGIVFDEAHHAHAYTVTGAGHGVLSTGRHPGANGIVGNDWWSRGAGREIYCVEDPRQQVVGRDEAPSGNGRSPANLTATGLGDWLKQASPESKVFSVAIKDRAAVLMGGRRPDGAYWYDSSTGRFVTSTYYAEALPEWAISFNTSGYIDQWFERGWPRLRGESDYPESRRDDFPAEADGRRTSFPHRFDGEAPGPTYYGDLRSSPFGDQATLEFAMRLIEAEALGTDDVPDLLSIGLSAADSVGHVFGPYSQEIQDYYLRLDGMLALLLDFLDERVGLDHVQVALSSDHGVLPMPEELQGRGVASRRLGGNAIMPAVAAAIDESVAALGLEVEVQPEIVTGLILRTMPGLEPSQQQALRREMATRLRAFDGFADVYTRDELADPTTPDRPYLEAYRRMLHAGRGPDLYIRLTEHTLYTSRPTGTSHGSPYRYDTHVPLIFWRPGLTPLRYREPVRTVDLAPTVMRWLGFDPPAGLDGTVLEPVIGAS